MNTIVACAESVLQQHVHSALRLSELLEAVAQRVDRTLDLPRLRAALEAYPDRFRILDPWQGPWRTALQAERDRPRDTIDVWVVALSEPTDPPENAAGALIKLRESVRWLARGIDPCSRTDVSRWYAIVLAEREIREAVAKRAA